MTGRSPFRQTPRSLATDLFISPSIKWDQSESRKYTRPTIQSWEVHKKVLSLKRKVTKEFPRSLSLDNNNAIISLQRINTQVSWDLRTL